MTQTHASPQLPAQPVIRLGLIGHNSITLPQAQQIRSQLQPILSRIYSQYPQHTWQLLTPLAPGSDYILTSTILNYCQQQSLRFQLKAIQALKPSTVVAAYQDAWQAGGSWNGDELNHNMTWAQAQTEILNGLRDLMTQHHGKSYRLPSMTSAAPCTPQQQAFQYAARWIVQHAQLLIAVYDPQRGQGGPGGTFETLQWWQQAHPEHTLHIINPIAD